MRKFKKECKEDELKRIENRRMIVEKNPGEFIYYEKYLLEVNMKDELKKWSKHREWLIKVDVNFKEME